jgi:hypothetical protein
MAVLVEHYVDLISRLTSFIRLSSDEKDFSSDDDKNYFCDIFLTRIPIFRLSLCRRRASQVS